MQSVDKPFPGQKHDEKVILFVRKHWMSFLGFAGLALAMILILLGFIVILAILLPDFFISFRSPIILLSSAYLLFVLAFFLVGWIDYYFDIVIVTNKRIVDIHQRGLFSRDVDELDLLHVEDVSARVKGVFPTIFHYGDVHVQTAGASRNFRFESIPFPQKMCRNVMALYDRLISEEPKKLQTIDRAEGLSGRHNIHPSAKDLAGRYREKENSGVETKFQKKFPEKTGYQKQIERDKHLPIDRQSNVEGVIPNDDQVDVSDGPPRY